MAIDSYCPVISPFTGNEQGHLAVLLAMGSAKQVYTYIYSTCMYMYICIVHVHVCSIYMYVMQILLYILCICILLICLLASCLYIHVHVHIYLDFGGVTNVAKYLTSVFTAGWVCGKMHVLVLALVNVLHIRITNH